MKEFTKEEKAAALRAFGWESIVGYAMGYEAPESDNIIVSLEEVRKWIGEPAQEWWSTDSNPEYMRDTEDAWECLIEELYNELDTDEDNKIEKHIAEKIK